MGAEAKQQGAVRPLQLDVGGSRSSEGPQKISFNGAPMKCCCAAAAEAARRVGAETRRQEAVRPLQLDVVDPDSVSAAVEAVRRDYDQRICCLVNNGAVDLSGKRAAGPAHLLLREQRRAGAPLIVAHSLSLA